MAQQYNQFKAMLAITKASLTAMFRSPSSILFSIGFPMIFILTFGFIGNDRIFNLKVAFDKKSDTLNPIYPSIKNISALKFIDKPDIEIQEDLEKGRMTAVISIQKTNQQNIPYQISLKSSEAVSPQNINVLRQILQSVISDVNKKTYPQNASIASINENIQEIPGRVYRTIDFVLPGILGFSLLSAGVFGVAFLFFNLRQLLVLKRFYATPIKRPYIILGETFSRVIFQMMGVIIVVLVGVFFFHFTLVHGVVTFLEILVLSFIALLVFMGLGYLVGNLAKSENVIPIFSNIFTLPQFLLAGTFFSIDNFPKWLQPLCNILPLTYFNNAMRNIAFEGASLIDSWKEIGILLIWGVIIYALAIKLFKWE